MKAKPNKPFIPANKNLPEITLKAVLLGILLAVILAAANAYLGLKIGTTVSASIPAAVISMGILRLFKKSNILENNIVQTAASAGEALVAGIAFILPALVIINFWHSFNYLETVLIALLGGILGVFFSVPLRRILLARKDLRFPEGTAIGQVLKSSVESESSLHYLVKGSLLAGAISFAQNGLEILSGSINVWYKYGNSFVYGIGAGFDPALIGAGYIIGMNVVASIIIGIVIGWLVGVPVLTHIYGIPAASSAANAAMSIWSSHIRYIGVGAMLVGGFWILITLFKPIIDGLRASFSSKTLASEGGFASIPRTERDVPIHYVSVGTLLLLIPIFFLVYDFLHHLQLPITDTMKTIVLVFSILFIPLVGFIFSALGGYFAGLVGSTNSPGSALNLAAMLITSLFFLALLGPYIHFSANSAESLAVAALAILICSVISAAIVVTNETIQDLKAGSIVGATPWKQQVMLLIGVVVSALVLPLILQLLFDAYGIGGVFPRPGMDPTQMLAAPQAGAMAALVQGVFTHTLMWSMFGLGGLIAVITIVIDHYLKPHGLNLHVLAIGFGIYLPLDTTVPLVFGGVASYIIGKILRRRFAKSAITVERREQRGLILACGLVAGAALMGVILAIPFALAQSTDVLKIVSNNFMPIASGLSILITLGLLCWMYRVILIAASK